MYRSYDPLNSSKLLMEPAGQTIRFLCKKLLSLSHMTGFPFSGASGQWSGCVTGLGLGKSGSEFGALFVGGRVVGSGLRSIPGHVVGSGNVGGGSDVGSGVLNRSIRLVLVLVGGVVVGCASKGNNACD